MFLCGIQTRPNWEMHVFRWGLCLTYEGLAGQGAQCSDTSFFTFVALWFVVHPATWTGTRKSLRAKFAIPLRLKIPNAIQMQPNAVRALQDKPEWKRYCSSDLNIKQFGRVFYTEPHLCPMHPNAAIFLVPSDSARGAGTLYRRRATTVAWCQSPWRGWAARLHFRNERDRRTCRGQENHGSQLSQSIKDSKQM